MGDIADPAKIEWNFLCNVRARLRPLSPLFQLLNRVRPRSGRIGTLGQIAFYLAAVVFLVTCCRFGQPSARPWTHLDIA